MNQTSHDKRRNLSAPTIKGTDRQTPNSESSSMNRNDPIKSDKWVSDPFWNDLQIRFELPEVNPTSILGSRGISSATKTAIGCSTRRLGAYPAGSKASDLAPSSRTGSPTCAISPAHSGAQRWRIRSIAVWSRSSGSPSPNPGRVRKAGRRNGGSICRRARWRVRRDLAALHRRGEGGEGERLGLRLPHLRTQPAGRAAAPKIDAGHPAPGGLRQVAGRGNRRCLRPGSAVSFAADGGGVRCTTYTNLNYPGWALNR